MRHEQTAPLDGGVRNVTQRASGKRVRANVPMRAP